MKTILPLLLCVLPFTPVAAHPHIFIDTGIEMEFDAEGRLVMVEVTWVYDDLYSLVVTEELGLDQDGDGILTKAEEDILLGFDMQWIAGFDGDLQAYRDGNRVPLSGPRNYTATLQEGRIVTTHRRQVEGAVAAGGQWQLTPFDPTFYTLYEIRGRVEASGPLSCEHRVDAPDIEAGLYAARAELFAMDEQEIPDPSVARRLSGILASSVVVACPVS